MRRQDPAPLERFVSQHHICNSLGFISFQIRSYYYYYPVLDMGHSFQVHQLRDSPILGLNGFLSEEKISTCRIKTKLPTRDGEIRSPDMYARCCVDTIEK